MHEDPITKSKRVTNSAGSVVSTIELDPWGADTSRSNNAAFQPKKFTSYDRDGNGADEAMFRRFNRWHSRFDQPDPYDGSYDMTDPQSFNRYSYVQNDPVNFTDPSGLVDSWNCTPGDGGVICGGLGNVNIYGSWGDIDASTGGPGEFGTVIRRGGDPTGGQGHTGPQKPTPTPTPQTQTPIYCQPDVIKAMNTAWSQSGNAGMAHPGSRPIEAGFNLNGTPTNYKVTGSFTNEVGKMTIKYDNLNSSNPTFANFHVHPKGFDTHNGFPSTPGNNYEGNGRGDTGAFDDIYNKSQNGQHQAIQVYMMSWQGLAMYDPATGKSTQLVKGTGFLKGEGCPR
jgi:RHS repeat-associated protein